MKKFLLIFFNILFLTYNLIAIKNINYIHGQPIINLECLLKIRSDIRYTQLSDSVKITFKKSPLLQEGLSWWESDTIIHPHRFIVSIPDGKAYSSKGLIIVNNMYVDEFLWSPLKVDNYIFPRISKLEKSKKYHNKIAVITQGGANNYYDWMVEILPKLAMLQESGIEYDYLYVPYDKSYMKETIELLGIDSASIIEPFGVNQYIQADELIVPSRPSAYNYLTKFVIDFLRKKFIPLSHNFIKNKNNQFAERIFISRRGACRKISNEDEVFALFEPYGFVRYNLEELSVLEQIMLFYNAKIIVGEHGAGLTNIIFAQPETQIIEIFQARKHMGFWYLCQELGLRYHCVKTIDFHEKNNQFYQPVIPLDSIKNIINQLLT